MKSKSNTYKISDGKQDLAIRIFFLTCCYCFLYRLGWNDIFQDYIGALGMRVSTYVLLTAATLLMVSLWRYKTEWLLQSDGRIEMSNSLWGICIKTRDASLDLPPLLSVKKYFGYYTINGMDKISGNPISLGRFAHAYQASQEERLIVEFYSRAGSRVDKVTQNKITDSNDASASPES